MSKTFYICDQTLCVNCWPDCHHTSDETHAVNKDPAHRIFTEDRDGNRWEVEADGQHIKRKSIQGLEWV